MFPLHEAVRRLDLPQVQHLAKSETVNVEDNDGHPPLWYAVEQLRESAAGGIASLLVSRGATVQLHMLFLCGVPDDDQALEMLKILLDSSPSPNINEADTSTGLTLLHVLAGSRLNKCVGFVLGRGAHITKDRRGRTPGLYALQPDRMYEPICKLHNLDIDQEVLNDMDNMDRVITEVGVEVVYILLQLVKCGMDLDDADEDGQSLSNILGS